MISERYLTILDIMSVLGLFWPFQFQWVGFAATFWFLHDTSIYGIYDVDSTIEKLKERWLTTNMWFIPVALVWNLAMGPFEVLSLLWVINNEILALPLEIFLVLLFIFTSVWISNYNEDGLWIFDFKLGYPDYGWSMYPLVILRLPSILYLICFSGFSINNLIMPGNLPSGQADINDLTVSGESGGGFMASQMSVIYSGMFKGVGIVYGGPYGCVQSRV